MFGGRGQGGAIKAVKVNRANGFRAQYGRRLKLKNVKIIKRPHCVG